MSGVTTTTPVWRIGTKGKLGKVCASLLTIAALTGCDENGEFALGKPANGDDTVTMAKSSDGKRKGKMVERDVEAPELFEMKAEALWDGRPSLGGVWVAHPDVDKPERVMMRNEKNGKFVVGALFRRERDIPGPKLQLSSDAAEALGILAGAPTRVNVVALKREEVEVAPPAVADPEPLKIAEPAPVDAPAKVEAKPLDPIAAASAALKKDPAKPAKAAAKPAKSSAKPAMAKAKPAMKPAAPKPVAQKPATQAPAVGAAPGEPLDAMAPATQPAKDARGSRLDAPFVQVGVFSLEEKANEAAGKLREAGMTPVIKPGGGENNKFWRVVVGPAMNKFQLMRLTRKTKRAGFDNPMPVSN